MAVIWIAWAFGSFLFFKIAFDWFFDSATSIVASLLIAILAGIAIFAASYIYAMRLLRFNWSPGAVAARYSELVFKTIIPFLGISLAYALVSRAVIFGFSKELNREIRIFSGYRRQEIDESILLFAGIIVMPIIIHYLMSLIGTYNNANRGQP